MSDLERDSETRWVNVTLLRGHGKDVERRRDQVALEEPLHIFINGER